MYTSTMLYIWLRRVRFQRTLITIAQIVFGGLAGFALLKDLLYPALIAVLAFVGSMISAISEALGIETRVNEISRAAAEFKSLQDRFRRCATVTSLGDVDQAEATLAELMDRMDIVRGSSLTPPERYFQKAKEKIEAGDYSFAIDEERRK